VFHEFAERFPNRQLPSRPQVQRMFNKFKRTGVVADAPRTGRNRSITTDANMELVALSYVENAHISARRLSRELQISDRSIRRMLKRMHFRAYRPHLVQALHKDDFDCRMEFCEWFLGCHAADAQFYRTILWTDEATFKLNGQINRHNCVYWASENAHVMSSVELNEPGICVWAGIHAGGLIGPYFFDGTVTGQTYLELLEDLRAQMDVDPDLANIEHFMQDGAPPHYALIV